MVEGKPDPARQAAFAKIYKGGTSELREVLQKVWVRLKV
jgi:hypothetical protein